MYCGVHRGVHWACTGRALGVHRRGLAGSGKGVLVLGSPARRCPVRWGPAPVTHRALINARRWLTTFSWWRAPVPPRQGRQESAMHRARARPRLTHRAYRRRLAQLSVPAPVRRALSTPCPAERESDTRLAGMADPAAAPAVAARTGSPDRGCRPRSARTASRIAGQARSVGGADSILTWCPSGEKRKPPPVEQAQRLLDCRCCAVRHSHARSSSVGSSVGLVVLRSATPVRN